MKAVKLTLENTDLLPIHRPLHAREITAVHFFPHVKKMIDIVGFAKYEETNQYGEVISYNMIYSNIQLRNEEELEIFLKSHYNVSIDGSHMGAGNFRDYYIGTGSGSSLLVRIVARLNQMNLRSEVTKVDVKGHPDFGKNMLILHSFWDESAVK